jgi:hypothetical protein
MSKPGCQKMTHNGTMNPVAVDVRRLLFYAPDNGVSSRRLLRGFMERPRAQLMNYLRTTGLKVGLLINFSHDPGVEPERLVI